MVSKLISDALSVNSEQPQKLNMPVLDDCALLREEFDASFYLTQDPQLATACPDGEGLIKHFLDIGWREGLDPQSGFSTHFYLSQNADVRDASINPFVHYLRWGRNEGRAPSFAAFVRALNIDEKNIVRPYFDASFYRIMNEDLEGDDDALLMHFMTQGWREGRDPSASFSCSYYLETYPDIAKGGINPFLHYVVFGKSEGRAGRPENPENPASPPSSDELMAVRPHFDASFYRIMNEDLEGDDDALLIHFMTQGWREGRDPSASFSCSYYLETYPDIAKGGINPFLHYVVFGKSEGRRPIGDEPRQLVLRPSASLIPAHLAAVMCAPPKNKPQPMPPMESHAGSLFLHWVIPDFARGSGGHMTIFRTIRFLEMLGHRCKIWIESPVFHTTALEAWENIVKYFQCVEAEVAFVQDGFFDATGDALVATGWSTAYLVHRANGFAGKFYFVQDHETEFYPTGAEALLARETYSFGLNCICASPWLAQIMRDHYSLWARHFYLAYDPDIYRIQDPEEYEKRFIKPRARRKKIAVYAREHTARRCVALALMALDHLARERDDFEVHFFGQDHLRFGEAPFAAINHGVVSAEKLADLYNDCDIGICFSGTNYSLVPQEMMACGLPVLELDGDSTRAIFPKGVVKLAGPDPINIASRLSNLMDDHQEQREQAKAALNWVKGFSWEGAAKAVETAIIERLGGLTRLVAPALIRQRDVVLDVVIPTYNGMGEIECVVEALSRQQDADRMQIHCIDSSSQDGTADWLRKRSDVSLTVIDQKDFQHGRTRNFGASLGRAPLIGFLTQDATPVNSVWATDIAKMFAHVPKAAGLFGRHKPYPHHPEAVRDEIERHFDNMLRHPLVVSKDTDPVRWASGDLGWRQLLHFYSDNNSAMRRSVWQDIPYPEVDYGEDQVWARDIIEAGYAKIYAPTVCVYHSHDYDPVETYKRAKIEGEFFMVHFGYQLGNGTDEEIDFWVRSEQEAFRTLARKRKLSTEEITLQCENIRNKYRGWRDGREQAQNNHNGAGKLPRP